MCFCDLERPAVYEVVHVQKARKSHKCSECCEEIPKGSSYVLTKGLWDGRWDSFKTCSRCWCAATIAERLSDCFCPALGGLWEEIDALDLTLLVNRELDPCPPSPAST